MLPRVEDAKRQGPWWRRALRLGGELLLVAIVAMVAMEVVGQLRAPELPDEAPELAGLDLAGAPVALADHRGRWVVVNFWATWCTPCRLEIPALKRFADSNPDVLVLGVAVDEDRALVQRTVADLEVTYPVMTTDPATRATWGVSTLPTTVVVDPEGRVTTAHSGLLLDPHLAWALRGR